MTARLHSLRHQEKKSAGSSHRQHHQHSQHQQAVHQGPSPAPSPSPSLSPSPKHSDGRRANKPLMEKRRRARINQSLAALKALILDSARLENTKHSKLEKADILELTVRHLQRQRSLAQPGLSRYKAGYQDCSREVSRYLDAPDIITGNTTPMDPAVKQRLLRHLDSCVSELDLDLGSRPDSGLGSSPGSVTDRVAGATSPGPLDHHVGGPVGPHCSTAATLTPAGLIKSEIPEMEAARPDSSTTAGDENNNSSRPTSAFSQVNPAALDPHHPHHPAGLPVDHQASTSQQNPNMLSVVQVIPSRLPDGQVVFLLPSHYVQLAAAAAANGISIGPNPPTAIWAATNMSLLKATDKLAKRPHEDLAQEWIQDPTGLKPSKSPRMEQPEQPLDFTTTSKKMKTGSRSTTHLPAVTDQQQQQQHHLRQQQQQQQQQTSVRLPAEGAGSIVEDRPSSHADSEVTVGMPSPSPVGQQPVKDEEGMWRPW
ncbi:protein hairy [Harpegnathos saltator]|uniref:Transcription factor HES-4 n=1 Tax=Harpegnathos saltator TaxID=610380 RepID=E2BYL5_HARSA|nr:protein hairy [Harpegnathos saltator]EFN79220.1 Transcription factor HES-4 [Harpegnathos saltator]